jgi:hypothetical protein
MRNVTSLLILSVSLLSTAKAHAELCAETPDGMYAASPKVFADAWLPQIERLYTALPSISPREEQWLTAESSDPQRHLRAIRSSTYAIKEAKLDVGSLLGSLRVLPERVQPAEAASSVERWALFAYTLIDYDAALHLARLAEENIVERSTIPERWTLWAGSDFPLDQSIRAERTNLARHVLVCIIPQVDE